MKKTPLYKPFIRTLLVAGLSCLPLVFFPAIRDFYDMAKWMFLIILALFTLSLWAVRLIVSNNASVSWSGGTTGFSLLVVSSAIGLIATSTNKIEAIVAPFGLGTFTAVAILLLFGKTLFGQKEKILLRWGMVIGGAIIGLLVIYQQFGVSKILFPKATYLTDVLWNPLGSPVALLSCGILVLPIAIGLIRASWRKEQEITATVGIICGILILTGMTITVWQYVPRISTNFLPFSAAWMITLEGLKNGKTLMFGYGAENFLTAFTVGRPLMLNMTPVWNVSFLTNASLLLHIVSTLGVLGLAGLITLCIEIWNTSHRSLVSRIEPILIFLCIAFVPPTFPMLLMILLILMSHDTHLVISAHLDSAASWTISLIVLCITSACFYGIIRYYGGERAYFSSLVAAQNNDANTAYQQQIKAIQINPVMSAYHLTFSQMSLSLANGLIESKRDPKTGEATLNDDDRQAVLSLVNQAIQEAKQVATLTPGSVMGWTNLARTYQGIIGSAEGSDAWAVAAYQKAIQIDPTNPVLRLDLGILYVVLEQYDNAIQQFMTAVTLKNNYTNGYYNLANVLKLKGNTADALSALKRTRELLPKNASDYGKLEKEIQALEEEGNKQPSPPQSQSQGQPIISPQVSPALLAPPLVVPNE